MDAPEPGESVGLVARQTGPVFALSLEGARIADDDLDTALPLLSGGALHPSALHPAALANAARSFGLTPRLAQDLVADVCDQLDAARGDALHAAAAVAGEHPVLDAVDVVVHAMTTETRRRLLGFVRFVSRGLSVCTAPAGLRPRCTPPNQHRQGVSQCKPTADRTRSRI